MITATKQDKLIEQIAKLTGTDDAQLIDLLTALYEQGKQDGLNDAAIDLHDFGQAEAVAILVDNNGANDPR
jgi:hypothetical protein